MNAGVGGSRPPESFNIRSCMVVIGVFGIITIISYFNELAKAGLLFRNPRHRAMRSVHNTILHRGGGDLLQHVDLDLAHVKHLVQAKDRRGLAGKGQINIALNLGMNHSYESVNQTKIKVYQHQNTMPNYFLSLQRLLGENATVKFDDVTQRNFSERYQGSTRVLVYQHEWGGYAARDCLKSLSEKSHLPTLNIPLGQSYRHEWEMLSSKKKQVYKVIFGGLSFGVCESIKKPCNYFTMVTHPIDRVLQVYHQCNKDPLHAMCRFDKSNVTSMSLRRFIKAQGNGYFKKLLYYSRHCKLVGDDELCLQDARAAFILSARERQVYLDHVLDNLGRWFGVIGLVERFADSMELFEEVYGQNFTGCRVSTRYLPHHVLAGRPKALEDEGLEEHLKDSYYRQREQLLNDTDVRRWLQADMKIYQRLVEIFDQQMGVYKSLVGRRHTPVTVSSTEAAPNSTAVVGKSNKKDVQERVSTHGNHTTVVKKEKRTKPHHKPKPHQKPTNQHEHKHKDNKVHNKTVQDKHIKKTPSEHGFSLDKHIKKKPSQPVHPLDKHIKKPPSEHGHQKKHTASHKPHKLEAKNRRNG